MKKTRFRSIVIGLSMLGVTVALFADQGTEKKDRWPLQLIKKIPCISEEQNYFIIPAKDRIKFLPGSGEIMALSFKEGKFFRFKTDGSYAGAIGRNGEGPCELQFPADFFILANKKTLILDKNRFQLKVLAITDKCEEIERFTTPYSDLVDIVELNSGDLLCLTAYPLLPEIYGDNEGNFLHIFGLEKKQKRLDFFPVFDKDKKSSVARGEYGEGDILLHDDKIFLVYNQPSYLYILDTNGKLDKRISTQFPFTRLNRAYEKRVENKDAIQVAINIEKNCKMNLVVKDREIYLLSRINQGDQEKPAFVFYLSRIDFKEGKIERHSRLAAPGIDLAGLDYKCFSGENLLLCDDDFLYVFKF